MILGVTGLIGSGKSEVGKQFANLGVDVIDCDDIVHKIYEYKVHNRIVKQIEELVGSCTTSMNVFDKRILGRKLFENPSLVQKVNDIVHPFVKNSVTNSILNYRAHHDHLVILAPLLFEAKMESLFDSTLYVYTDHEIRKERLMDKTKRGMPLDIMNFYDSFQIIPEEKVLLCDHVIFNNNDSSSLYDYVERLFMKIF